MRNVEKATECTSEIVLPEGLFGNRWGVCVSVEPAVRIQGIVAQVVERSSVILVCARARLKRKLASGAATVLCGVGGGSCAKLLECIDRNETLGRSESGLTGSGTGKASTGMSR